MILEKYVDEKFTPLHALAYKNRDIVLFEYFLNRGFNMEQQDLNGDTAFINASFSNNLNTVKFLYQFITNINIQNKFGVTPLMKAIENNSSDVVEFLLQNGASINIVDNNDNGVIHYLNKIRVNSSLKEYEAKLKLIELYGKR